MPTFDTPEPITAIIDILAGRVWIRAGDRADTVVEVRPSDASEDADVQAAEQTLVEYADGRLSVRAPKHKFRSLLGRAPSIDVTIELPSDSRVDARAAADVRGEGRLGESTFHTAAGSVRLDQTGRLKLRAGAGDVWVGRSAGHLNVTTTSGKIRIGEVDGIAVAKTSNGDITIGEVTGDVRLNTANGDITVDRALATVVAKTAYGSVRIGEVVRGSVVLETNFGQVELGVREGTAAWLDVGSRHGGVRSGLDAADGPEQAEETVKVHARTGYGDIVIHRSRPL
ncbi:DUF4097 and DUF4098 domain-containing protein YvlB [Thermomonospora echinospora]|uniref:DUF4097 and DUF4098 domain-containing protein YvlB n=1 Tax=Thermomonospora echinospora TaxID=1992 RepID=A0A1H6DGP3_9ACTN|nr:DUF4097 family beta strand repeat-containing protein [Thermomonospora echinospora]SEG84548.1 DUF4097 and DUF4098 domain-containing protein YvlB [Thermomonospora echinospora]